MDALRDTACGVGGPLASSSGDVDRAGCLIFIGVGLGGGLIRRRLEARVRRGSLAPSMARGIGSKSLGGSNWRREMCLDFMHRQSTTGGLEGVEIQSRIRVRFRIVLAARDPIDIAF